MGIEPILTESQSVVLTFTLTTPYLGGNGEIRTHTERRMKAVHNHYATLPYRNTLLNSP